MELTFQIVNIVVPVSAAIVIFRSSLDERRRIGWSILTILAWTIVGLVASMDRMGHLEVRNLVLSGYNAGPVCLVASVLVVLSRVRSAHPAPSHHQT